jgi:hypothetical protein
MELIAYLDDGGTDDANPRLVVGGFAADALQWSKFNDEVALLDREFEAPPFHAKTFEKARHGSRAVFAVARCDPARVFKSVSWDHSTPVLHELWHLA